MKVDMSMESPMVAADPRGAPHGNLQHKSMVWEGCVNKQCKSP